MKCIVPSCDSRQKYRAAGVSFHRLPDNEPERIIWMEKLGVPNFSITKYTRVCSQHFSDTAFVGTNRCRRLTAGAIPIAASPLEIGKVQSGPVCADFMKIWVKSSAEVPFKEQNGDSVCSGSSLSGETITYDACSPKSSPNHIRSDTTENVGMSRKSSVTTPGEKMGCTCGMTSIPSSIQPISMDSTTANPKENTEHDHVDSSEDTSGLVPTKKFATVGTITGPDLAYYHIQRLEAQVKRLRETIKQKDRTLHNLRQKCKRNEARLSKANEMLHELKIENLVSKVRQKQLDDMSGRIGKL